VATVAKLNTVVESYLTVYDAANVPVVALVDANFTKFISINGIPSALAVTVTEVGNGQYVASFVPNVTGSWYLLVRQPANNPRGWDEEYTVTVDGVFVINEIFDKPDGVETGYTLRQALRVMAAGLCGVVSGGPNHPIFRSLPNTANRMESVDDVNGNRTIVNLTP